MFTSLNDKTSRELIYSQLYRQDKILVKILFFFRGITNTKIRTSRTVNSVK